MVNWERKAGFMSKTPKKVRIKDPSSCWSDPFSIKDFILERNFAVNFCYHFDIWIKNPLLILNMALMKFLSSGKKLLSCPSCSASGLAAFSTKSNPYIGKSLDILVHAWFLLFFLLFQFGVFGKSIGTICRIECSEGWDTGIFDWSRKRGG